MTTKKKIKDYINKSVRKLKHRKGFGVHSPFAYRIITEVIEEKLPYYQYQQMQRVYHRQAPLPFKVAALLFRLSNRFHCRQLLEIGCDEGYSILPLTLVDSRNQIISHASSEQSRLAKQHLSFFPQVLKQVSFVPSLANLPDGYKADMIVINGLPNGMAHEELISWLFEHIHGSSVIFVRGIQPGHQLESFWDAVCDSDDIEVTMDLYDFGLAIHRPRFFKQHYVVSF